MNGPGRPHKIDRELLHKFLWETSDRSNFMTFSQGELAKEFNVTAATMSLIFKELIEDGRVKKIGAKWKIIEPDVHKWHHVPEPETLF